MIIIILWRWSYTTGRTVGYSYHTKNLNCLWVPSKICTLLLNSGGGGAATISEIASNGEIERAKILRRCNWKGCWYL